MAPVVTGRDVIRVGIGLLLLIDAALLVRIALGGTPGDLEQLVTAAMLIVLAGALAALAASARADGAGGYAFADPARARVVASPTRTRDDTALTGDSQMSLLPFLLVTTVGAVLALLRPRAPSGSRRPSPSWAWSAPR